MLDLETLKEIPSYQAILKLVLKSQIQFLAEQLGDHGGEECVVLTASTSEGSLSHLGSKRGKQFIDTHADIKAKFLVYCLRDVDDKAECEQETETTSKEQPVLNYGLNEREAGFVCKKRKVNHNDSKGNQPESVATSVNSSQVVSNGITVAEDSVVLNRNHSGMYEEELARSNYHGKDKDTVLYPSDRFGQFKMDQMVSETFNLGIPSHQVLHDLTEEDIKEVSDSDSYLPPLSSSPIDSIVNTPVSTEVLDRQPSNTDKTSRSDIPFTNQHKQWDLQSIENKNKDPGSDIGVFSAAIKEEPSDDKHLDLQSIAMKNKNSGSDIGIISAAVKEEPPDDSQPCSVDDIFQTDKNSFMCDVCFRVFKRKFNMQQHRQLHFGIKQFLCPTCNKRFARQDRLRIHCLRHHSGINLGMKF